MGGNDAGSQATFAANTTGSYNVALGMAALRNNTTSSYNTAVGYQALYSQTTSVNPNVAVGRQAGYNVTTGGYNVVVGELAGYNLATGVANTFIGVVAGYTSTGSNNTFIGSGNDGYGAGWLMTSGSKNTIIGAYSGNQGGLDIRSSSNYIVLSDGDGNPRLVGNQLGTFAIGNTAYLDDGLSASLMLGSILAFLPDNTGNAGNRNWAIQTNGSQPGALDFVDSNTNNSWANNAYRAAITPNGITLGGSTNTSGMGLTFPATQSASSNANTLDDYEEGTWTPVLNADSTPPTVGYSVQVGFYTKIGRVVTVCGRVSTSSRSGGSGSAYIDGLPFAGGATNNPFPGALEVSEITFSSGKTYVNNRVLTGSVQMAFSQCGSAGGAIGIPIGSFASACDLVFSCVYFV
jgi:hypothetical protein